MKLCQNNSIQKTTTQFVMETYKNALRILLSSLEKYA